VAHATVSDLLRPANVFEDDSNEYVLRPTPGGPIGGAYSPVVSGALQVNDVLLQVLDFPIVNGTNIDSQGFEFTGVGVNKIVSMAPVGLVDPDGGGPIPSYQAVNIIFGAASAADWLAITSINITALGVAEGFDPTGLMTLLYEQSPQNLDISIDGFPAGVSDATDGILRVALSLLDADDYLTSSNSPLIVTDSLIGTPGVTQYGTFNYNLDVVYQDFPNWTITSNVTGSGTNLTTNRPTVAGVIDDTQANFRAVPEPGTLLLLGCGALGLSRFRRFVRS